MANKLSIIQLEHRQQPSNCHSVSWELSYCFLQQVNCSADRVTVWWQLDGCPRCSIWLILSVLCAHRLQLQLHSPEFPQDLKQQLSTDVSRLSFIFLLNLLLDCASFWNRPKLFNPPGHSPQRASSLLHQPPSSHGISHHHYIQHVLDSRTNWFQFQQVSK